MEIILRKKFSLGRLIVGKRYKVYDTYTDMQKNYGIMDEEYRMIYVPASYVEVV